MRCCGDAVATAVPVLLLWQIAGEGPDCICGELWAQRRRSAAVAVARSALTKLMLLPAYHRLSVVSRVVAGRMLAAVKAAAVVVVLVLTTTRLFRAEESALSPWAVVGASQLWFACLSVDGCLQQRRAW